MRAISAALQKTVGIGVRKFATLDPLLSIELDRVGHANRREHAPNRMAEEQACRSVTFTCSDALTNVNGAFRQAGEIAQGTRCAPLPAASSPTRDGARP